MALVKVLNPAFYGGADVNANPNMSSTKKEDTKLRSDKNKTSASKSMPKNVSKQQNVGNFNKNINNNNFGYDADLTRSKKKNPNKSNEHFEKDKKIVSILCNSKYSKNILHILCYSKYKKKISWIYSKVDIINLSN